MLARELDRVVRDLRRLDRRLTGDAAAAVASSGADSVAHRAHRLAQALADAAAGAAAAPRRAVPRLADHALADQVAVVGRDLLDLLRAGRPADLDGVNAALGALRPPPE
ncbi:hypothetical protein [Jiangella gansuensis]|uniref:hypothetical protein n=1 Tax=Jiangella gansuensis TaxID=281473 RepID=UPI0012F83D19|nr:hypothetical protein [Jiangella gansuensis]